MAPKWRFLPFLNGVSHKYRHHCHTIVLILICFSLGAQYTLNIFFYSSKTYLVFPNSNKTELPLPSRITNARELEPSNGTNSSSMLNIASVQKNPLPRTMRVPGTTVESTTEHTNNLTDLPLCPLVSPNLVGPVKVLTTAPSFKELEKMFPDVALGGRYWPKDCQSRYKVAIIIPYRERELHLRIFLHNLHPMLQRQKLDYGIFVTEQAGNTTFNRGMIMNAGFLESRKLFDYHCLIFHDVDLMPENDLNIYSCSKQPRHFSVAVDVLKYRLPYPDLFGGVRGLTVEQMKKINGFSNSFWGWGGEDDDMTLRIYNAGYRIIRYTNKIARYQMMKHKKDIPNPKKDQLVKEGKKKYAIDGLNSIQYTVLKVEQKRLYTWIYVKLKH